MLSDHDVSWTWWWNFLACSGRTKADEMTSSAYMLRAFWKDEVEQQYLDRYHWIDNTGCLEVEDVQAIAREVWD